MVNRKAEKEVAWGKRKDKGVSYRPRLTRKLVENETTTFVNEGANECK